MLALLALSTGIFADHFGLAFGSVRVMVRHKGPPQPFSFHIRTKESKAAQWEYIDEQRLSYFPRTLMTSPQGRQYRVRIPSGLKNYAQLCSRLGPPKDAYSSSFRVLVSVESCANLPSRNQD